MRARSVEAKSGALPAHQERSKETRELVVSAATEVIRERGVPEFSIEEIASAAGCSVGTIYRRFGDKESLFNEVMNRWIAENEQMAEALLAPDVWEGRGAAEILEFYLRTATANTRRSGALPRALLLLAIREPEYGERTERLQRLIERGLRRLLLARKHELGHPDPATAIPVVLELVRASLLARRFGPPLHQPSRVSDERFVAETLGMVRGYLQLEERPSPE